MVKRLFGADRVSRDSAEASEVMQAGGFGSVVTPAVEKAKGVGSPGLQGESWMVKSTWHELVGNPQGSQQEGQESKPWLFPSPTSISCHPSLLLTEGNRT